MYLHSISLKSQGIARDVAFTQGKTRRTLPLKVQTLSMERAYAVLRFAFSDKLALAGLVLAIVLVVLDKAGKLKGPMLLLLLAVAAVMTLPLALGNPWVSDATPTTLKFARGMLMVCVISLLYAGIAVWITTGDTERKVKTIGAVASPQIQQAGYLFMSGIQVFPEYSVISAGKRLKFRVTFTNNGSRPVDDTRSIVGINIAWEILSRDMELKAARDFREWINSRLDQDKLLKGPQVAPGASVYSDVMSEPLEPRQADAVLKGTGHVRLYIWAGWKTEDGHNPELGHCVRLITPKSKQIVQGNATDWEICPFT
jgi:hypothetical protein